VSGGLSGFFFPLAPLFPSCGTLGMAISNDAFPPAAGGGRRVLPNDFYTPSSLTTLRAPVLVFFSLSFDEKFMGFHIFLPGTHTHLCCFPPLFAKGKKDTPSDPFLLGRLKL